MMTTAKEKIWDVNFIIILVMIFFHFMSVYLLLPIMPIYLIEHLNATNSQMAIILAGFSMVAFFICPFAGYMIDNFKRRPVLIIFNILFLLICLTYVITDNLLFFGIDRSLNGAAYGMVTVFGFTMTVNSVKHQFEDNAMLYYGIVSKCGMAFAPAISILMFKFGYSFNDIFVLSALFSAIGLLAIFFIDPKKQHVMKVTIKSTFDKKLFFKVIPLAISLSLLTFTFGIINNYMATNGIKNHHQAVESAIFFTMLASGMILLRLVAKNRVQRDQFSVAVPLSVLGIVMGTMTIAVWNTEWLLYVMALLTGAGFEMLTVIFRRMFIDLSPPDRIGIGASNYYMSWDLGMGAGIIVGSILSRHHPYLMIFAVCTILLSAGAIFFSTFVFNYYRRLCK